MAVIQIGALLLFFRHAGAGRHPRPVDPVNVAA
jgi:hypothetical protein